jgi:hypothetical protein
LVAENRSMTTLFDELSRIECVKGQFVIWKVSVSAPSGKALHQIDRAAVAEVVQVGHLYM